MIKVPFPIPATIEDMIDLLNQYTWSLILIERNDRFELVDGDQLVIASDNKECIEAFLYGCFHTTFWGNTIDDIKAELAKLSPGTLEERAKQMDKFTGRKTDFL